MSTKNRGDRIQLLQKVVTKHFTPVEAPKDRSVLEHMIYACCLEDAKYDDADEAFHRLQESFFDWNEIRVTTISELCESLQNLPDASVAAMRIKKNLQSLFETRYSFELDDMIKMNLGKAVQELEKLAGMTRFVLAYMTQNALGGHAIPVSNSIMKILLATEIVTEAEAEKGQAPGLERTVPKTKGAAFASCLHQLAIAGDASPENKQLKAILKEAGATEKKPTATPAKKTGESKVEKKAVDKPATSKKTAAVTPAEKPKTKAPAKKAAAKKAPAAKPGTKKPIAAKPEAKSPKKSSKRKPR